MFSSDAGRDKETGVRGTSEAAHAKRRKKVMDAAVLLAARGGLEALGMRDVVARAGVSSRGPLSSSAETMRAQRFGELAYPRARGCAPALATKALGIWGGTTDQQRQRMQGRGVVFSTPRPNARSGRRLLSPNEHAGPGTEEGLGPDRRRALHSLSAASTSPRLMPGPATTKLWSGSTSM